MINAAELYGDILTDKGMLASFAQGDERNVLRKLSFLIRKENNRINIKQTE